MRNRAGCGPRWTFRGIRVRALRSRGSSCFLSPKNFDLPSLAPTAMLTESPSISQPTAGGHSAGVALRERLTARITEQAMLTLRPRCAGTARRRNRLSRRHDGIACAGKQRNVHDRCQHRHVANVRLPFLNLFPTDSRQASSAAQRRGTDRFMRCQSSSERTLLADYDPLAQLCSWGKTRPDGSDTERTGQHGSVLLLSKASARRKTLLVRRQA